MSEMAVTTEIPDDRGESELEIELEIDRILVVALKAGDPRAPRQLVERFQSVVFALCRRMLTHHQDAEDVVQETFLRALRSVSGFEVGRPLRPWLLGIAANRCRTALGRRGRRIPLIPFLADRPDPRPEPTNDLADELELALDRLRPEYRMVFVLFHEQELPYEEIAVALGRPVGTIKTWLHRARAELAEFLSRRGISVTKDTAARPERPE